MEYFQFSKATPKPCLSCNRTEVRILQEEFEKGLEDFWVYHVPAYNCCNNCDQGVGRKIWRSAMKLGYTCLCPNPVELVCIPIKTSTVGVVERAIHASSVGEKGSEFRAHGTFISHLVGVQEPELYKQALTSWAPSAMMGFAAKRGVKRVLRKANPISPSLQSTPESQDPPTAALTSAALKPEQSFEPANPDVVNGKMLATELKGDEYGPEKRVTGNVTPAQCPKELATQIGPDLIPTEVMGSTMGNLKAAVAKRVQPLPFRADKKMVRKIEKTVSALIDKVFSKKKIARWREQNPMFTEMKSSKWSDERWSRAWYEALAESQPRIEQTFQIKVNEALPAKGKAPRAIIQSGDRAQVLMKLPVKCFEELLFDYFEDASIKHLPKHEAMGRVAKHLRHQVKAYLLEGDGSAWDACCNRKIRDLTENRVIDHIIKCLGGDWQVPDNWLRIMLDDMSKPMIKGKAKVTEYSNHPVRVAIDAIRQSGHAGTSCFNYFINLVVWLCVLAENPWDLIRKDSNGCLQTKYISARDGKEYELKYAFEGDDSALSTTEDLKPHAEQIEASWTSLGFRMKLVYVKEKMTFTGFDFLCDEQGPVGTFLPEIARNVASSAWSCSSELKRSPDRLHQIGAAAMLARAENFKDCGPYSRYFAALGLAHARRIEDFGLGEAEAISLGIHVSPSVKEALQVRYDGAQLMDSQMRKLVNLVAPFESFEAECRMVNCDFGLCFDDYHLARELVPFTVWDPAKFERARR